MFNLFKHTKKYPEFPSLNIYEHRDSYFIRIAVWDFLDADNITITDPNGPRVFTLDEWPQIVFIAANGQMTVKEFVYFMANKYDTDIPGKLDETIIYQLNQLSDFGVIKFVQDKQRPESLFELPKSKQERSL